MEVEAAAAAQADRRPQVSIESNLTATDNADPTSPQAQRSPGLIGTLRPTVVASGRGPRYTYEIDAAAAFFVDTQGQPKGGVQPNARGAVHLDLLPQWLQLDAVGQLRQAETNPFGPRADRPGLTNGNRSTERLLRLSPVLKRSLTNTLSIEARQDISLDSHGAGSDGDLSSRRTTLHLERQPTPVGGSVDVTRMTSQLRGAQYGQFSLDSVRTTGLLAHDLELTFGATAGAERSRGPLGSTGGAIAGGSVQWQPGPRTRLAVDLEHRFFGMGGQLSVSHRTPFLAFELQASRQPLFVSDSLDVLGRVTDVRQLLDSLYTTRYPDVAARQLVVDDLLRSRGIDPRLQGPINVVADAPRLQTRAAASVAYVAGRNSATLSAYTQTVRALAGDSEPVESAGTQAFDNRQVGAQAQFERLLTPTRSVQVLVRSARIVGLGPGAGSSSTVVYALKGRQDFSPRTSLAVGIETDRSTTSAAGQHGYRALLVYIGWTHRF